MTFVGKFTFVNGKKPCRPNLNFVKTEYDERLQTLEEVWEHIKGKILYTKWGQTLCKRSLCLT